MGGELTSRSGARYNLFLSRGCATPRGSSTNGPNPSDEAIRTVDRPPPGDDLSQGMYWASRITTIALEFALPALLGLAVDRFVWRFSPAGVLLGAVLGFAVGMMHLLKIAQESQGPGRGPRPPKSSPPGPTDHGRAR